jgi:hypothetical protein
MRTYRTQSGLLVPECVADLGRHPGISKAEWNTLSKKNQRYFADVMDRGGIGGGAIAGGYLVMNGPMPTTAAPASVTTGATIKSLMQIKPAVAVRAFEWGISFDGSAAAVPGKVELIESDVAATVTAYAAADVMKFSDLNVATNSAGTSGAPLNLGTTHSGYTSSGEGTTTASRVLDPQLIAPTNQYVKQAPLDREPHLTAAKFTRWRVTFAVAVNAYCYVCFEPTAGV